MIEVVDALLSIFEPVDSGVAHDDTGSQPLDYAPLTIYGWPTDHRRIPVGTRELNGPAEIDERFTIRVVYVHPNPGEASGAQRDRDVTLALDAKASGYLDAVTLNGSSPLWDNIAAVVDHDFIRQLEVRGVAIVVSGNKLRSS